MSPDAAVHIAGLALHHVGIVTGDLDESIDRYRALGFVPGETFGVGEQAIVAVTMRAGPGWVEIIQPTDPDGPIARYLAKRGPGVHHLAYRVADLAAELDRLATAGVRLIDTVPRTGAHGWQIAFVHPEACGGVLTELVQVDDDGVTGEGQGS